MHTTFLSLLHVRSLLATRSDGAFASFVVVFVVVGGRCVRKLRTPRTITRQRAKKELESFMESSNGVWCGVWGFGRFYVVLLV